MSSTRKFYESLTRVNGPKVSSCIRSSKPLRRLLFRVSTYFVLFSLLLQIVLAYIISKDARLLPPSLAQAKSLLIVTAHPDDECLFFSPAILGILDGNPDTVGSLLVLSTGNNYGLGELRKEELRGSCSALGIQGERCIALDRENLQDNPKIWWDDKAVLDAVEEYIDKWKVDAIITFDQGGISGHLNHRAVSKALNMYKHKDPNAPPVYALQSASLLRKYTFIFDLPLTSLPFLWRMVKAIVYPATNVHIQYADKALIANSWSSYAKTWQAFGSHGSQFSWDRYLYLILSRQVWFNELRRIEPGRS